MDKNYPLEIAEKIFTPVTPRKLGRRKPNNNTLMLLRIIIIH
jgi:hypothetical protein